MPLDRSRPDVGGDVVGDVPPRSLSAPERIAATLRADLLDGALRPGERLREESLTTRFEVGRHTIRAAIRLLVAKGLVVHERHRGAFVPALTRERINSVFEFRTVVELGSLTLALDKGSTFADVETAVQALEALPADTPWRVLTETHNRIHHEIVRASGNHRLLSSYTSCEDELQLLFASIRPDFSAARLARIHRHLLDEIGAGHERGLAALRADLDISGRASLLAAIDVRP